MTLKEIGCGKGISRQESAVETVGKHCAVGRGKSEPRLSSTFRKDISQAKSWGSERTGVEGPGIAGRRRKLNQSKDHP